MPVELWESAEGITRNWQLLGDLQPYMLNFLENHDEQRFASDFFGKDAAATFAPLYVSLMLNTAPFMIYFGEEVGERGMEQEGFSGLDGRTTIFDWWSIASIRRLRRLIASGKYRDESIDSLIEGGLEKNEAETFIRFSKATRLASSDEAITKGTTYDLCYCNASSDGFDKKRHFAFLRDYKEHTLLIVANFSNSDARICISIPPHAFEWMEIPATEKMNPQTVFTIEVPAFGAKCITLI